MRAKRYLEAVRNVLNHIEQSQTDAVDEAAEIVADSIESGGSVYVFGTGHAGIMAQETFFRAGGLVLFNPVVGPGLTLDVRPVDISSEMERIPGYADIVLAHTPIREGDVLFVISTAGRNAVPIDAALWAKKRQIPVIAITSRAWAQSVASRHPSGKKLHEVADVVLDDGVPAGDAAVELAGLSYKVGPVSTVAGVALINAVVVQTADKLLTRGIEPPVIVSANTDGADEINRRNFERFKDRIHYR